MARRLLGIDGFVSTLCEFEQGLITRDSVLELCSNVQIRDSSLERYLFFDEKFYTRNLIYRDDLFEVMAICWGPGHRTAVHTHNGQLCWMIPQQGNLGVVDYKWMGCDHPENQNVVDLDCLAGSEHTKIEVLREVEACAGGAVLTADKLQTIHRLFNLSEATERAVSIHIYSRPFDSCVAFDMEKNQCYRRQLAYFSRHGEVVPKPEMADPPALTQITLR
ncbi:MAG: cysteine dioxygenase family protein [Blastocatellia bacterium]|nr:cysteine dioxygenase family protein [Blastocatellia bacterium]